MTGAAPRWGVVATAKAEADEILQFAAFHLDAGATRVHVFLDEPAPEAFAALKAHPNCRVTECDDAYWHKRGGRRPVKHQVRQTRNATFGYNRSKGLDWVVHIDIDEFLVSDHTVATALSELPADCLTARVRPMEALTLSGDRGTPCAFKAFIPNGPERRAISQRLYSNFGTYVRGGFLSHVAGKVFARTGQAQMHFKIHNAVVAGVENPRFADLAEVSLAHCHASNWAEWRVKHAFRHEKGSYRADLSPAVPFHQGGTTLHALFESLIATEGDAGLRRFFDEVCADSQDHRDRLEGQGLLRLHDLDLAAKLSTHFPKFVQNSPSV